MSSTNKQTPLSMSPEEKQKKPKRSRSAKNSVKKAYLSLFPQKENVTYLLFAFCIAVLLWFTITQTDEIEAQYDIYLEYTGLADGLIVKEGLQTAVSVRLRGSAPLFSTINNRQLTYTVDLSDLGVGASVVPLELEEDFRDRAFDVISVQPEHLLLTCENLIEKEAILEPLMMEHRNSDEYTIANISVSPETVVVQGAESVVTPITRILVPFTPSYRNGGGTYTESVAVMTPQTAEASPPIANITYTIEEKISELVLSVPISLVADNPSQYTLSESNVEVTIKIAVDEMNNNDLLEQVEVIAMPSGASLEEVLLSPRVPENVSFVSMNPQTVVVTKQ